MSISLQSDPLRNFRRLVAPVIFSVLLGSGSVEAQLFGGKGLFDRKTDAPLANPTEDEIGVPVPLTGRVEALKGTEIQFEIKAETKTPGAMVEFLIRDFPTAGKIVAVQSVPTARDRAFITYYPDPNSGAEADVFTFAARYRNGRYSSAVRFDIDLVTLTSEIQVDKEVDFGEVMVGSEEVREISVSNLGSGSFERQLILTRPWYLVEPANGKLSLGPRGSQKLKVAFRPDLTGETSYFLSLSRSATGTTKLIGSGAQPFQLVSDTINLQMDPKTRERSGEIQLMNNSSKPLLLSAQASTRLQRSILGEYVIGPEKVTPVRIKLGPTDTAPFDGAVQFSLANGFTETAKVVAPVVPAKIEIAIADSITSELIHFGKVEGGRSTERSLTITNVGGVAVPLNFHIPEPFRLLTNPGPQLGALSSVQVSVGLYPAAGKRGLVDATMSIFANDETIPIRLMGTVTKSAGASATSGNKARIAPNLPGKAFRLKSSAPAQVGAPEKAPARPIPDAVVKKGIPEAALSRENVGGSSISPLGFETSPFVKREINPELRPAEDLSIFSEKPTSLTLGWTAPKGAELMGYQVEVRAVLVDPNHPSPKNIWVPYPHVQLDRIDRLVKAKLSKLSPANQYEMRVIVVDENGRSSVPSDELVARTTIPMDWTNIYLGTGIFLFFGLSYLIYKIVLARRPEVYQAQYADS